MELDNEIAIKYRLLPLFGEVTMQWYKDMRLRTLELLCTSNEPISLLISSQGGDIRAGFFAHDWFRALPCPVHTYAVGECYSSAFDVFLAGEYRFALPHSLFLIHNVGMTVDQLSSNRMSFEANLQERRDETLRLTKQVTSMYAANSSLTTVQVQKIMDKSDAVHGCFDPPGMLKWGFVTEIVTKLPWNISAF